MTASALLDGRIDWQGTLAQLNATQTTGLRPGIVSWTSDQGMCVWNGTAWVTFANSGSTQYLQAD